MNARLIVLATLIGGCFGGEQATQSTATLDDLDQALESVQGGTYAHAAVDINRFTDWLAAMPERVATHCDRAIPRLQRWPPLEMLNNIERNCHPSFYEHAIATTREAMQAGNETDAWLAARAQYQSAMERERTLIEALEPGNTVDVEVVAWLQLQHAYDVRIYNSSVSALAQYNSTGREVDLIPAFLNLQGPVVNSMTRQWLADSYPWTLGTCTPAWGIPETLGRQLEETRAVAWAKDPPEPGDIADVSNSLEYSVTPDVILALERDWLPALTVIEARLVHLARYFEAYDEVPDKDGATLMRAVASLNGTKTLYAEERFAAYLDGLREDVEQGYAQDWQWRMVEQQGPVPPLRFACKAAGD